jgi:hypothetical protein
LYGAIPRESAATLVRGSNGRIAGDETAAVIVADGDGLTVGAVETEDADGSTGVEAAVADHIVDTTADTVLRSGGHN